MKRPTALATARHFLRGMATTAQAIYRQAPGRERRNEQLRQAMRRLLEGRHGDVAAHARALELMEAYRLLPDAERLTLFETLASFGTDEPAVDGAIRAVHETRDSAGRSAAERTLRATLEPGRVRILRELGRQTGGVKFVVDLRAALRALPARGDALEALDADMEALLATWFDVGLLELRRVTWDAPASLLEKLAGHEAVHDVRGWVDLKDRLDLDRRCFCFFHPAMPDEPLIFVEVALLDELAASVQRLLDPSSAAVDSSEARVAIFFSISNCQEGLAGISLGNVLIKRVVARLAEELPGLRTFATLSPVPGFSAWLRTLDDSSSTVALRDILAQKRWRHDAELTEALREPLVRLCARYVLEAKRPGGGALDPVAHFHLSNGARVERINWLADTSPRGLRHAAGMMLNYVYRLDHIDANQAAYAASGRIDVSAEVGELLARRRRLPAAIPPA